MKQLIILLLLMSVYVYGHDITGRIVEVQTLEPIAGASVHLFTPDSTRVNSVVSTANGRFVLKKALPGNGGVAGASMRHALSTVYGIDNIYARTNYKESEIGVTYYSCYAIARHIPGLVAHCVAGWERIRFRYYTSRGMTLCLLTHDAWTTAPTMYGRPRPRCMGARAHDVWGDGFNNMVRLMQA